MLRPDTLIHDRYRIVRLIASGGFGMVYEAIDERLNQRVALKQLMRVNERIGKHFTNEARLLASLNHPALPRVTDYFPDANGPFLVMDYVPGDDLATMLYDRNAPFPVDEVLALASKLLDVLDYLHTREPAVIHRDIKPQNLKLRTNGTLILLDFGLAKGYVGEALPSSAASSMTAFTRGFAPLEQVEGTGTDARSDLYALGATLYCLLTNNAPPEAQMRLLNLMRGRPDPLVPAHLINPAVPEAISQVLQQTLEVEMDKRPNDAPTLRAMLNAAQDGVRPAPPRIAEPTEIHTPTPTVKTQDIMAHYEAGVAFMVAQQWAKALHSLELVERHAPGYRDTHARLVLVRQELNPVRVEPLRTEWIEQPPANPPSQPRTNPPSQPSSVQPNPPSQPSSVQPNPPSQPQPNPPSQPVPVYTNPSTQPSPVYTEPLHTDDLRTKPAHTERIEQPIISEPPAPPRPARRRGWLWPTLGAATLLVVLVGGAILWSSGGLSGITTAFMGAPTAEPVQDDTTVVENSTYEPTSTPDVEPTGTPESGVDIEQELAQHYEQAMAAFGRRGGLDEAIAEANAAVELAPNQADPHAMLALFYMQRFDWDAVALEAQIALDFDPEHAIAHSFLSQARREQGDFDRAMEEANRAIELQSDLSLGFTSRALVYLARAQQDYDHNALESALSDAEQAVSEASDEDSYNQVEAYAAKASVLAARYDFSGNRDDIQQAIEEYRQAIGSHVELAWHYVNLGNILVTAERYDDANNALDEAIERDPDLYSAYEARGWLLYNQADYDAAIEQFTKAIDLSQDDPSANAYLGRGFAHQGKAFLDGANKSAELGAASTDVARAIEISPDQGWSWYNLGSIQQDADNSDAENSLRKALEVFNQDLQRNSENASAYEGIGWTHWRLNELDEAREAFDSSLAANPHRSGAYQGKAYVLNVQEGKDSACAVVAEGKSQLPDNAVLQSAGEALECY